MAPKLERLPELPDFGQVETEEQLVQHLLEVLPLAAGIRRFHVGCAGLEPPDGNSRCSSLTARQRTGPQGEELFSLSVRLDFIYN